MENKKSGISYASFFVLTLIVVLISLAPLLMVSRYDVPAADDYSFSCETHAAVNNNEGFPGVMAGAWTKVKDVYVSWQGTFSAIFMMALQPAIWGIHFYRLTAWLMLFSLGSSILFFGIRIFSGVFKVNPSLSGIISLIIFFVCVQFLPSANQGFFWYNSSVYYTFTFSVMLAAFSIAVGFVLYGGIGRYLILCFLNFFLGGNNYVTALISSLFSVLWVLLLFLFKNQKWKAFLVPTLLLLAAFVISVCAPGNSVRQAYFTDQPGVVEAILLSFSAAASSIIKWADLRYLSCMLLIFPFIWNASGQVHHFSFRFPALGTLFSYCLLSAMFTPQIYAMRDSGPDRLKNIIYFSFVLLSVIDLFWWCGWFHNKKEKKMSCVTCIRLKEAAPFFLAFCICFLASVAVFGSPLSSVIAVGELRSGEAQSYYNESMSRIAILEDPSVPECEFASFSVTPYLLHFTDMTDDPEYYENQDACTYYSKNSIIVK